MDILFFNVSYCVYKMIHLYKIIPVSKRLQGLIIELSIIVTVIIIIIIIIIIAINLPFLPVN
jgi:hypothetical protein